MRFDYVPPGSRIAMHFIRVWAAHDGTIYRTIAIGKLKDEVFVRTRYGDSLVLAVTWNFVYQPIGWLRS